MTPHDEATMRQIAASRPGLSTWVSANAGSGKTKVLTDRVARLLLDGVDPQHILCLTYTKAAAAEMQNRLFATLGAWAMLPDDDLIGRIRLLGHDFDATAPALAHARSLFARAIETPGGLKIQTIHSFSSALLRRFPLEAGVTPRFTETDERAARLLRAEVVDRIASGAHADRLYALARHHSGETLDGLTREIVANRAAFADPLGDAQMARHFGLPPGCDRESIAAEVFQGGEMALLAELVLALRQSSPNDVKAAAKLAQITAPGFDALPVLESVLLTGAGAKDPFSAKSGSFPTKSCREANPHLAAPIDALMVRTEAARERRLALLAMEKTRALHEFAGVFLPTWERAKLLRGWLDFDDLILRARDLLSDRRVADWVLYKLDGGIDHILVDEAQDTSPAQWQVIEHLAREFTAGEGTRPSAQRTIFVVGDKKQSIYSFQGADPREFDRLRDEFAARLAQTAAPLQTVAMEHSFRSSPAVLELVDATFEGLEDSGFAPEQSHKAFRAAMPGRVDLWPPVTSSPEPEARDWYDPLDQLGSDAPAMVLARTVADAIAAMIGTPLPDESGAGARPIKPGDILVLVQRRSEMFHEIIRACKARGVPVAGADRLKVAAELAVRDLAALLSFLAIPEDSLSLATALRSPLFGWDEGALFDLAHGRTERYLWAELRDRAAEFPATLAVLDDLRAQADYLRPFELLERVLTRHDGRRRLLARLGPEAEDGIDALLAQAMAYEQDTVDSLTGFLVWLETDDLEIKRQMGGAGDRIRVMTVHGAKGLEAPVVILPDTARRQPRQDRQIAPGAVPLWRTTRPEAPQVQRHADEAAQAADAAERDRLLYVAMTRARQWLIVAAAGELGNDGQSWHDKVRTGLERLGAGVLDCPTGAGLRHGFGVWPDAATQAAEPDGMLSVPAIPAFLSAPAPEPPAIDAPLSPSDLGGAKALPGDAGAEEDAAKRRGRQLHLLLEHLPGAPEANWPDLAGQLLAIGADAASGAELADLVAEASAVLRAPALAPVLAADALAEVAITAPLPSLRNRRIHGVIDRLLVTPDRVLAADFKSNAVVPARPGDTPEGLLRQMGAYAEALAQIYPGRRIETALVWTRTATLMPLPHDLVTAALRRTPPP